MKLSHFTDIGLRTLIYLTQPARAQPFIISRMAAELHVSSHHLVKVVNFMGRQGWILTFRGRNGGITLARNPADYRLGTIIRILEERSDNANQLVNCHSPECPLSYNCKLKSILQDGMTIFTSFLEQYTLADAVRNPQALSSLMHIPVVSI